MLRPALLVIVLILLSALAVRYNVSSAVIFSEITLAIKSQFHDLARNTDEWIEAHIGQAETIEALRVENAKLKEESAVLTAFAAEVLSISKLKDYNATMDFRVVTVRTLSYAELPDLQRIIIDYNGLKEGDIKGLIYDGQTAGIVVDRIGNYSKALLNGDQDCAYSVYVGEVRAPGVAMGRSGEEMIVRYIPQWIGVQEGDEVITNGLDGIFFAGVKVGVVTKINKLSAYTEAVVRPYYKSSNPDYFYVVESAR